MLVNKHSTLQNPNKYTRLQRTFANSPTAMKVFTQKLNPLTGVAEWDIQSEQYDYHQEIARSAYADMLHDTERNQKYYIALKKAIDRMHSEGKKANVLDIGTGTGLLSIMAVQCGADSVVACESFQPMADCAHKIRQHYNAADKITLIPKRSTDITVGENGDMKERANILVTEVFDTELIGEGALGTFSHAHRCLLQPGSIVVPDSAVIYAQVVECPELHKWNKLNDLADEELITILRTPEKIRSCAGSAAVHDIQLSQLPRESFRLLSEPIPVFCFDWSDRTRVDKRGETRQTFNALDTGVGQMVFMWWDLNMDTDGTLISCAPWWNHLEANPKAPYPQDTIPWRDHWMQAVYYFPKPANTVKEAELTLTACHDEYSLWFYLESDTLKYENLKRPVCDCGVHMILSRTHVSYLNDGRRTKKYLSQIQETMYNDSVVLNLNGGSLLGLAAAAMGAKTVYYIESNKIVLNVLKQYISENGIKNVEFFEEIDESKLNTVTHVIGDPNFTNAILPWDNLRLAYMLYKHRGSLNESVIILPRTCALWAVPVQFLDLHKIRIPLGACEGIDLTIFDELVEKSRKISDEELEPQPLWEYPCVCRGAPQKIFSVDFHNLQPTYSEQATVPVSGTSDGAAAEVNGVCVWACWGVGEAVLSAGPLLQPSVGERIQWDTHTRQAVYIMEKPRMMSAADRWSYQVDCDLTKGRFNIKINVL